MRRRGGADRDGALLSARRDRWQEWGETAERIGIHAFFAHMTATLEAEPVEHVTATTITPLADGVGLAVGETLLGEAGLREETGGALRFVRSQLLRPFPAAA